MTPCIPKLVSYIVTFGHIPLSLAGVQLLTKTRKQENVCRFVVRAHPSVSVSKLEKYWGFSMITFTNGWGSCFAISCLTLEKSCLNSYKISRKKVMPNLYLLMESKERVSYLHMVFLLLLIFLAGFLLHWSLFLFTFFFFKVWGRCLFMLGLHACWLRSILWVVNVQQTSQLWTAQCSAQLDDTLTPLSVRLCFYNLGQLKWSNLVIDVPNAINREAILTFITFPYCLSTPFISRKAIGHSYKYSLH